MYKVNETTAVGWYQLQLPGIYLNPRLVLDAFAEICEEIMKYVLVTGGVISGIGKGVVSSSIGVLLQHSGVPVTAIKIDPYINIGDVLICICIILLTVLCTNRCGHLFSIRAWRGVCS